MPIRNIVEILERTQTGEYCSQKEWDTKRIPQTIRSAMKRHGLEKTCDQENPVNADMAWFRYQVIDKVNGRPIRSLGELVETLEGHEGQFQVIEFEHLRRIGVLDRERMEDAHDEILQRYGIPEDRRL